MYRKHPQNPPHNPTPIRPADIRKNTPISRNYKQKNKLSVASFVPYDQEKKISLSLLTQSINHFPLHVHHFMPFLQVPNACQLASQGVPLILSTSHFMASSKMDGMTLESFITSSRRQAKQTNISFTADPVNQAFSAACSPFHAIFANTKRMSTVFSGCPLDIVNEPFHGLIENGWHDT